MRIDQRKISVATSVDTKRPLAEGSGGGGGAAGVAAAGGTPVGGPQAATEAELAARVAVQGSVRRRVYFEDVEVRRSRSKGVQCRVTLRKGEESYIGEAEGLESERSRVDLAARATLSAIAMAEGGEKGLALDGAVVLESFGKQFVFVGVTARKGRESALISGSCEIRDSAETAAALAVLDATNRWTGQALR
jgi:hypothetical protein